jgi:hypothetical protein
MLKFSPFGMSQETMDELVRKGQAKYYSKRDKKLSVLAHDFKEKPTHEEILYFARENDLVLPEDYVDFLLDINGGHVDDIEISGHVVSRFFVFSNPLVNVCIINRRHVFEGRMPKGFLPVADDPFGNLFLMDVRKLPKNGTIYFWNHDLEGEEDEQPYFDNMEVLCESFSKFLDILEQAES